MLGGPLGLGGILGARSRSTTGGPLMTFGLDLAVTRGALFNFAFSSSSRFEGGRGGSLASHNGGGSFLDSAEEALVVEDPV